MSQHDGADARACDVPWCQRHEVVDERRWHVWEQPVGATGAAIALYGREDAVEICPDLPDVLDPATAREAAAALARAADLAETWPRTI